MKLIKYSELKKEIIGCMEYILNWIIRLIKALTKYTVAIAIMLVGIGISGGLIHTTLPSDKQVNIVDKNVIDAKLLTDKSEKELNRVINWVKNKERSSNVIFDELQSKIDNLVNINKEITYSNRRLVDSNFMLLQDTRSGIDFTIYMQLLSFFIGVASSITAHVVIKSKS